MAQVLWSAGDDRRTHLDSNTVLRYSTLMRIEDWPEEWQEWAKLTPMERFRQSEKAFAQYLAMGGSLDPDPDPESPFYDPS